MAMRLPEDVDGDVGDGGELPVGEVEGRGRGQEARRPGDGCRCSSPRAGAGGIVEDDVAVVLQDEEAPGWPKVPVDQTSAGGIVEDEVAVALHHGCERPRGRRSRAQRARPPPVEHEVAVALHDEGRLRFAESIWPMVCKSSNGFSCSAMVVGLSLSAIGS